MLSCQIELWHVRSGALGDCRDTETLETISLGRQSQGPDSVRPQESRVLPNLQSPRPKTGQVGGNPILLWLCHWTLRRKEIPGRWTIKKTRLRNRLLETDHATASRPSNYHRWTIRWPLSRNQHSSVYRSVGCRRETQGCWHSNCWFFWPAKNWRTRGRTVQSMECHQWSSHLQRKDICTKGWPALQQSNKPFQWQRRIRPLQSSQNPRVGITGFPLTHDGRHCTKIHRQMRTMPPNQRIATRLSRHKHAATTTITTMGRSGQGLSHEPPWVNRLRVYGNLNYCQSSDENRNLPPLQEAYRLTRAGADVFWTRDVQTHGTRHHCDQSQKGVYQPILELSLLSLKY